MPLQPKVRFLVVTAAAFATVALTAVYVHYAHAQSASSTPIDHLQKAWDLLEQAQEEIHMAAEIHRASIGQTTVEKSYNITVTAYNPEPGQTDGSPCIGAANVDLCELSKSGKRVMALSQDLVGRDASKPFHYGDRVQMTSNIEQCNGVFFVYDTMNVRFKNYGDLFFLNKKDNTSCKASIQKITN